MRLPPDEGRLETIREIGAHVEPTRPRTAAEPFDTSADGEVDPERGDVEGHDAG